MNKFERIPEDKSNQKEVRAESQVETSKESLRRRKGEILIELGAAKSTLEHLEYRFSPEYKEEGAKEKQSWGDKLEKTIGPYIDQAAKFLGMENMEDSERKVLEHHRARIDKLESELSEIDSKLEKFET